MGTAFWTQGGGETGDWKLETGDWRRARGGPDGERECVCVSKRGSLETRSVRREKEARPGRGRARVRGRVAKVATQGNSGRQVQQLPGCLLALSLALARRAEQSQLDSNDCQEIERGTGEGALARSARVWQGKAIKWGREQSKMSPGMAVPPRTLEVTVHQECRGHTVAQS